MTGRKAYTFSLELFAGIEEICLSSRFFIMGNGMSADVKSLKEVSLKNHERLSICGSYSLINLKVGGPVCALKYLEAAWASNVSVSKRKVQRCVRHFHHRCLKEVRLGGYYGRKSDLEVAIFFLEKAMALEKMILNPHDESPFLPVYAFSRQGAARSRAMQQLDGIVPEGVKLVILRL
ncbi:hypothetical protein RHMOL_Rhmol02G0227700 [Rhododendron molle]|uniref:Uncharacterized protein n=1 Tax=Rhododendron molle TaxID=49168 RepID=A0ACC0PSX2_RHOML|nr:hypothetical protein RHMOL_Rhmol02G0227700 [Rhododendron molle]